MALTRLELGELYHIQGGLLERRFLGSVLYMVRQIKDGGYPTPTAEQIAWADALTGADYDAHVIQARVAFQWGLANNSTLQEQGESAIDGDLDYIVAEYAKTYGS